MKVKKVLFLGAFALTSCVSTEPWLTDYTLKYEWGMDEISRFQVYLAGPIELMRELPSDDTITEIYGEGKIMVTETGRRIQVIRFRDKLPGIVLQIGGTGALQVSFSEKSQATLMFMPRQERYQFDFFTKDGENSVLYGEHVFIVRAGQHAYLDIPIRILREFDEIKVQKEKGRRQR